MPGWRESAKLERMQTSSLCALHLALGEREACPGTACAFWDEGGAVVESGCAFDRVRLEFHARPDLARWLLGVRRSLEDARSEEDVTRARNAINCVLPPGLHE
jgi:hypothetical protein